MTDEKFRKLYDAVGVLLERPWGEADKNIGAVITAYDAIELPVPAAHEPIEYSAIEDGFAYPYPEV